MPRTTTTLTLTYTRTTGALVETVSVPVGPDTFHLDYTEGNGSPVRPMASALEVLQTATDPDHPMGTHFGWGDEFEQALQAAAEDLDAAS